MHFPVFAFDRDNAMCFPVFAFDKDNAMYFPAGDQLFGDKSGLLNEKPQALRQLVSWEQRAFVAKEMFAHAFFCMQKF